MPKTAPVAFVALVVAGCSGSSSQNCPAGSQPSGNFSLTLALQHTNDECLLTMQADGAIAILLKRPTARLVTRKDLGHELLEVQFAERVSRA